MPDNNYWLEESKKYYPGWANLIEEIHQKLFNADPDYIILQIKEKFGGLRYYYSMRPDKDYEDLFDKVLKLADSSWSICEQCGTEENVETKGNWAKTVCSNCRERR